MLDHQLLLELEEYIDSYLSTGLRFYSPSEPSGTIREDYALKITPIELEDFVKQARKPTFSKVLFGFIDKKGLMDSDIYKRAGIDRRHFSKSRSNAEYRPGKQTAIALALALELNADQTNQLLSAAGYSLSDSDTFDLVIRFFVERGIYDFVPINEALRYFRLKCLPGVDE